MGPKRKAAGRKCSTASETGTTACTGTTPSATTTGIKASSASSAPAAPTTTKTSLSSSLPDSVTDNDTINKTTSSTAKKKPTPSPSTNTTNTHTFGPPEPPLPEHLQHPSFTIKSNPTTMLAAAEAAAKMTSNLTAQLSMALPALAADTNAMREFWESKQAEMATVSAALAAATGTEENDDKEDEGCLHCHRKVKGMPKIQRLEEEEGDRNKVSGNHGRRKSTSDGEDDDDDGDDNDDDDDSEQNIQVRCDECQAYICNGCHWCHEFQANHEIRVCDRCDAFYCKACDEMDQCDDCGEVVCGSCSTLLSCKFCGGGLCEECATACGRCGIVLCSRDAKFAVDCDTCRLSYCLVCLASGSKDPCVRCGHRPSKRMEQLVHLRLKSIYKAFKTSSNNAKSGNANDGKSNTMSNAAMASAAAANAQQQQQQFNQSKASSSSHHHHDHSHHGPRRRKPTTLQDMVGDDDEEDEDLANADSDSMVMMGNALPAKFCQDLEQNYLAEQKKADEAAEALLAELEEEEEANAKKKSKKKKKKERKQAKKETDDKTTVPSSETQKEDDDKSDEHSLDEGEDAVEKDASDAEWKNRESPEVQDEEEDAGVKMDPVEKELMECIESGYIDGIEDILLRLKGIPGRAILRKNAKKALKRLMTEMEQPDDEEAEYETVPETKFSSRQSPSTSPSKNATVKGSAVPAPKAMSRSSSVPTSNETFVPISATLVGWVIGKGGQRIRDMMEASGAKIWVDQEKVKGQPTRNVFISGDRRCVEQGVMLVKEVIANAPPPPGSTSAVAYTASAGSAVGVAAATSGVDTAPPPSSQPWDGPAAGKSQTMADRVKESTKMEGTLGMAAKAREPQSFRASTPGNDTSNSGMITEVVSCETRFVPLLIGKRGWTIKNIQDESGARVDIDQTVTPRQIKISGGRANVDKAVSMVRDVLSYPHAQLQHGTDALEFDAGGDEAPAVIVREDTSRSEVQPQSPTKEKLLAASARLENQTDRKSVESPPPIVGDAKSAISASSSLSSTPEPSMASSAKGALASQQLQAHLHSGSLLPSAPQQFAPGTTSNLSNSAPSSYYQSEMAVKSTTSGSDVLGAVPGSSAAPLYHKDSVGQLGGMQGRIEMHQSSIPHGATPHTGHQSHQGFYNHGGPKAPPMLMTTRMIPPQLQQPPQRLPHHQHPSQPLSSSFDPAGGMPSRGPSSMTGSSQYNYNSGMNQNSHLYSRSSQAVLHTPYSREVANAIATTPLRNLMGRTLTRAPPPTSSSMRSSGYRGNDDGLWQQQSNSSYLGSSSNLPRSGMHHSASLSAPLSAPSGAYAQSSGFSSHQHHSHQLHHAHSADSTLSGSMGYRSADPPLSHQSRTQLPFSNAQNSLAGTGLGSTAAFSAPSNSALPSQQKHDDSIMLESLFGTASSHGQTNDTGASSLLAGLNSLALGGDTGTGTSTGLWGPSSLTDSWMPSGSQANNGGGAPSSLGDILSGPLPPLPLDKSQESRFQWK